MDNKIIISYLLVHPAVTLQSLGIGQLKQRHEMPMFHNGF